VGEEDVGGRKEEGEDMHMEMNVEEKGSEEKYNH